ncbi:MAG: hypothetical protein ACYDEJ_05380 [Desulfitobacteriaceae bacterium]
MYKSEEWEEYIKTLNILLQKKNVSGRVLYKDSYDPEQKGFWYINPYSNGFLGTTIEEATEAVLTIIECIKFVEKPKSKNTGLINFIKKLIKP